MTPSSAYLPKDEQPGSQDEAKKLLAEAGHTQTSFARQFELHLSMVNAILNGRGRVSAPYRDAFEQATGVHVEEVFHPLLWEGTHWNRSRVREGLLNGERPRR